MAARALLARGLLWAFIAPLLALACGEDGDVDANGGEGGSATGGDASTDAGESSAAGHSGSAEGTVIDETGGVVVSDDGRLKLTIPAGALSVATPISITSIDADESSASIEDTTLRGAYRFEPDGTEFSEPATFEYTLGDLLTGDEAKTVLPMLLATTESGEKVETLGRHTLAVDLDTSQVTLSGQLAHFSQLALSSFEDNDGLRTQYFYVTIEPKPPGEAELGVDYGVGLFVHTRSALAEASVLTFDDESTNLDYSEGGDPYEIAAFGSNAAEPGIDIVPVGTYSCAEVGAATFSVRLTTDPIHFMPLVALGQSAHHQPKPHAVDVIVEPPVYDITISSAVACKEAGPGPASAEGAPYSGIVDYALHVTERQFGNTFDPAELHGAFYAGGAAQEEFDAFVRAKLTRYGITAERGASGTCGPANLPQAFKEDERPPAATVTHVGAGAADVLGFSFAGTQSEPALVPWMSMLQGYAAQLPQPALQPSLSGIRVFIPAAAATPTVTLPGWDEATWEGFASVHGEDGLEITWDAALIQADHVHALIIGYSDAGAKFAECFSKPEDQQLLIPTQVINDTEVPPLNEEGSSLEIYMYSARRTGVVYDGRTLEGLTSRVTRLRF